MNKKALIAMSGGVDSSVSALMMLEQGYECTGVTMKLFANEDIGVSKANSCPQRSNQPWYALLRFQLC